MAELCGHWIPVPICICRLVYPLLGSVPLGWIARLLDVEENDGKVEMPKILPARLLN
jgi:hypothetical protein